MDGGTGSMGAGRRVGPSPLAVLATLLAGALVAAACSLPRFGESTEGTGETHEPGANADGPATDDDRDAETGGGEAGGGETGEPDGRPDVRSVPCPFDTEAVTEVECGTVEMPGRGDDPDFTVDLMFARFASVGGAAERRPDPVVFLHGGPGGRAVEDAVWLYEDIVAPHISTRDVILYDQRGGGLSWPSLGCTDVNQLAIGARSETRSAERQAAAMEEALAECADRRFGPGKVDPTAYSTIVNVQDLVDLLRALDVEEYNLHGLSYGSRLAQAVLRDAPTGVRSVVLSGVYPTDVSPFRHVPATLETALDRVFDGCAADPDCGEALPDPWTSLESLVDDLDRDPTWVADTPGRGPVTPEVFDGARFLAAVHGTLYVRDGAAGIPDLLIDAEAGDRSRLRRLADQSGGTLQSVLASFLVVCADEAAFPADPDDLTPAGRDVLDDWVNAIGLLGVNTLRYCDALGVEWPAGVQDDPVSWDAPTLILAGAADPITPVRWARLVADRLPRARLIVNAAATHDADSGWCESAVMTDFVERPDRLVDLSCFDPSSGLVPNNAAGVFFDPLDSSVAELTVDGVGSVEVLLPNWSSIGYAPPMRWRGLDLFDRTVIIVLGPDDDADVVDLAGLQGEFGLWIPARSIFTPDGWTREIRSSFWANLVRYTDDATGLSLVLAAESGDPDGLEERLLAPAAASVEVTG